MFRRTLKEELTHKDFRVAIYGSARIKKNDKVYKQVFDLAKAIGKYEFDIVTGGGQGLMGAATDGHRAGDTRKKSDAIGLTIRLPWETKPNKHLEIKEHFNKFSNRLDTFMDLSSVAVIMPGGIGTCLELFYTLQLIQVKHISPIPVILVGEMWVQLVKWIEKYPVKLGLISTKDLSSIHIAKTNTEAMKIILKTSEIFIKEGKNFRKNIKKYKLNGKKNS